MDIGAGVNNRPVSLIFMNSLQLGKHKPRSRIIPLNNAYDLRQNQVVEMAHTYMGALMTDNKINRPGLFRAADNNETSPTERRYVMPVNDYECATPDSCALSGRDQSPKPQKRKQSCRSYNNHSREINPQHYSDDLICLIAGRNCESLNVGNPGNSHNGFTRLTHYNPA